MSDPKLNEEEEMDTRDDDSFSNSAEGSSDEEDADEERLVEIQKQVTSLTMKFLINTHDLPVF